MKAMDRLGSHEINKLESLSEEICEYVRGICANLQELIEEETLRKDEYHQQIEFLETLRNDIRSQRYLVNSLSIAT